MTSSVWGINATSNVSRPTDATVRLAPSRVIEPFSTTCPASSSGNRKERRRDPSDRVSRSTTSVTVSTCPWTTWPPNRPSAASGRSRLTASPGPMAPSVVRSRVSGTASTANQASPHSTTVRQQPFTAMEAPRLTSASTVAASTTRRRPSPTSSIERMLPSSSTIPVNMRSVRSWMSDPGLHGRRDTTGRDQRSRPPKPDGSVAAARSPLPTSSPIRTLTVGPGLAPDRPRMTPRGNHPRFAGLSDYSYSPPVGTFTQPRGLCCGPSVPVPDGATSSRGSVQAQQAS